MKYVQRGVLFIACSVIIVCLFITTTDARSVFDASSFGCDQVSVKEIDRFQTPGQTCISILKHKNGKRFIVKQKHQRKSGRWYIGVAREKLGAYIAELAHIRTNRVEIIPNQYSFPGKHDTKLPATLHEVVPGMKVTFLPKELKPLKVFIQQPEKPTVAVAEWGLTRRVIRDMSLHPDLPKIVALDTFIANADRHRGNFFYDEKSDHFFAIDLESSFNKNLACYACNLIKLMITNEQEIVSEQELAALQVYRNVLKKLIKQHSPESLFRKIVEFAVKGGIRQVMSRKDVALMMVEDKQSIIKNYASCEKLVRLLDKLMLKHS